MIKGRSITVKGIQISIKEESRQKFISGMWISAEFKIYLIKEFQRLKEN